MTTPVAFIGHLTAGRAQMGTSLAFHLTFAVLGVGLPLMMLMAEGMHLRTGDPVWRALARRWAKAFAVLFAVGAVSGTIVSFELGLLFPRFMAFAGGEPAVAPRPLAERRAGRHLSGGIRLLHRHRQRLDERPSRLPP